MQKKLADLYVRSLTALVFGLIFGGVFLLLPYIYFSLLLGLILLIIVFFEWTQFPYWLWLIVPFYPIVPFFLLIYLNQSPLYHGLLVYLFCTVFAHDTGAYIAGSLWGKTKIAPRISPQKSWEGSVGGYAATVGMLAALLLMFGKQLTWYVAPLSLAVAALATIGDFFESWIKRRAGIKNSGSLLPGHGGLLDRFDSVMAVTFLFFLLRDVLRDLLI